MSNKYISLISENYAKALMETSKQDNSFAAVKNDIYQVIDTINSSSDLKLVMENSSISVEKKKAIIQEIFKGKIDIKVLNLLNILVEKGRFSDLSDIAFAFSEMSDDFEKRKNVEIISSFSLDDGIKRQIMERIEKKLNYDIIPQWTVDEKIIAGLIFKFDDYVIDMSIKNKLKNLSKYMLR